MQYSRAGLVALLFALIISLVSAVPIPSTESIFSSTLSPHNIPNLNGQDRTIQLGAARNSEILLSGRMSTLRLPLAAKLIHTQQTRTDTEEPLVRRSKVGDKIKHAFQNLGHKIKAGFQKAGAAIKKGFQKAGAAIKKGFQKLGKGIVTAAKKVWHFVKTTGAKIVKFGLKVVQSVEKVGSKIVSWIPGIGKPLSKAMDAVSKVAGTISDHIHVKLSAKLEKGMKVMNKANKIMDYIPREFSEEEGFQQRDIDEAYYHFEERDSDDIALEDREESYSEFDERDIYER